MANIRKWYAVKAGCKTGIFETWEECKEQIHGFPGAVFKSFLTKREAEEFLSGEKQKQDIPFPSDTEAAIAYVDGSFNPNMKDYFSFGVVFIYGGVIRKYSQRLQNPSAAEMRNVAGEIAGAAFAMRLCVQRGIPALDIYYDYAGIEKWCVGEWKTNRPWTKAFKSYYDSIRDKLSLRFHKVMSHTGVVYNEMADRLAKEALKGNEADGEAL